MESFGVNHRTETVNSELVNGWDINHIDFSFWTTTPVFKRHRRETGGAGGALKPEAEKKDKKHLVSVGYIED